ncbi:MAG: S8 family serine peptidase [Lachnospiraceae bacterium]|nr:S8 family serine peptidase [Lachnospiraceae bacterium]
MRAKKKLSKRMLALLLSAVMIAEPASTSMIVHATEVDEDLTATEAVSEETENAEVDENAENSGSEENENNEENGESNSDSQENEGNVSEDQDNTGDSSSDQNGEEGENDSEQSGAENQDPDDQNPDEPAIDDTENGETEDSEDGVDVSGEELEVEDEDGKKKDEEDSSGLLSMPSDYKLTSEQKNMKSALSVSMGDFDDSAEGVQYVEKQVFAFADSREEAETIAEAYHAELIEYDEGVAVLKLKEGTSVGATLRVAASSNNNLPAVYPDYYRHIHLEGDQQENQTVEITEEEYELESDAFDVPESEEPSLTSYEQALEILGDPNMDYDSDYYQWQHVNVGSVYAWGAEHNPMGQGVKVAVLDSGVSGNSDIVPIEDINKSAESGANDTNGHGTHVAGIIAAKLNGVGGAGIAPEAEIINVKIANAAGGTSDSRIIQGIRAAIGKADIMNLSVGGLGENPAVQKAVDEAYEAGIALFVSAGNDGGSVMCYPAACNHVICVAAIDNNNQRASFSNYGAWVDLSAPGVDIWSTGTNNDFEIMSGTSQASPVAAGEAAVILSSGLLNDKTGKAKVDALESLMKKNTVSAGSGMGKGVTSLTKVFKLSTAATKPTAPVIDSPDVATDGQSVTFTIKAQAGTKIYYTDNGKAPSYKNGIAGNGTILADSNPVELTYTNKQALTKITISAIAVNESGVASAVKKVTAEIKPWVTAIEISGVSRIAKGKSTQLTAEVTPSYAKNKAVVWSIDGNPKNISVNAKGKVITNPNVEAKTYTIRATAKDRQGQSDEVSVPYSVTVTEDPDYIKSVKFTTAKGTVSIGEQPEPYNVVENGVFTPEAKPEYAGTVSAADFVWSSSNKALATVDASGVVTAKAPGSVKITATANDGSDKKAVFTLTIKQLATSVTIVGDDKVAAGASITLKAEVKPDKTSNKKVEWTSNNPDVLVKNGVVKPKAGVSGTYTITAKALDGTDQAVATKDIEVKKGKITGIVFADKAAKTIFRTNGKTDAAKSISFKATISGTDDFAPNAYTCTSSNPGIARVTATGNNGEVTVTVTATGDAAGKTTITLMATDGSKKKATCNVSVCNPVSKVHIAPTAGNSYYVAKKKSLQLKATLESEYGAVSNKNVTWELWTTNNYPKQGDTAQCVEGDLAKKLGLSISKTGKVAATKDAEPGLIVVRAYAADGGGAAAQYPIIVTDPVKKLAMWSDVWSSYGYYEEMTSKYVYNLPLVVLPYENEADGTKPYPFDFDLMCDWEKVVVDGKTGYKYKFPAGGVSVSSSNPKVLSVQQIDVYDETKDKYYPMIRVSPGSTGSATITVKAMDGGGAQTKIKFKVYKP